MLLRGAGCAFLALVLGAQQPATPPPPPPQSAIDVAIDRGVACLLARYADKLTPEHAAEGAERVGQTALCLYTLLKGGVSHEDPTVRKLLTRVLSVHPTQTYDTACTLLALDAYDSLANWRWIEELSQRLRSWQNERGDWSYPDESGEIADLSNTQYAALALWVAAQDGVRIEAGVWTRLAEAVLRYQHPGGGFEYSPSMTRGVATGSMTAAGVGTLAIAEIGLRLGGGLPPQLEAKLARARASGLAWLAKEFSATSNPGGGGWLHYYLYGLERLGAATGCARIGDHDWYGEGAAYLVPGQKPDGSWLREGNVTDTCFAVLFLKRATRRGPVTGIDESAPKFDSAVHLAAEGRGPVRMAIDRWDPLVRRSLEGPGDRGAGVRVARVEYVDGERTVGVQLGDPSRGCAGERFAALCVLPTTGVHALRARVYVVDPVSKGGELRMLESQVVEVDVARALPRWSAELEQDLGPNLALEAKGHVKASSTGRVKDLPLEALFPAEQVLDGSGATPWLADPDDAERSLAITFQGGVECNVIRVSPAVLPAFGTAFLARPVEIEIEVNGGGKSRLAMDPDPLHPMRLKLERKTVVRRLDVRILAVAPSAESPYVGIGEVELYRVN